MHPRSSRTLLAEGNSSERWDRGKEAPLHRSRRQILHKRKPRHDCGRQKKENTPHTQVSKISSDFAKSRKPSSRRTHEKGNLGRAATERLRKTNHPRRPPKDFPFSSAHASSRKVNSNVHLFQAQKRIIINPLLEVPCNYFDERKGINRKRYLIRLRRSFLFVLFFYIFHATASASRNRRTGRRPIINKQRTKSGAQNNVTTKKNGTARPTRDYTRKPREC